MKLGIIGVPNSGKTALFNSMTRSGAKSGSHPFSTKETNIGQVSVPEPRLLELAEMYKSAKIVRASIEFMDIAGLVRGSGRGEGLGNKFLESIRRSDALVHVVRFFEDDSVIHTEGTVDPERDIKDINFELILADLAQVEKRAERTKKAIKADKSLAWEVKALERFAETLEAGQGLRGLELAKEEAALAAELGLLTMKPMIYALNVDEGDLTDGSFRTKIAQDAEAFIVSAKLEEEMASLTAEERDEMLKELNIAETGLDKIIQAGYKALGLMSFLTAGPKEARAWTIPMNTKAVAAAGKIHSDIERGFIRAEVVNFKDLKARGSYQAAKEAGLVRLEGKEYILVDGDVVLFRFNV